MNGGHDAALNGSVIVKGFSHGCKAVGGAGSRRNNLVVSGKSFLVYAENDCFEVAARGSGNNNFLCACVDMSLRLFFGAVETGAFKNNVNADLSPRKIFCIFHCIDFDGLAVYGDRIFTCANAVGILISALCRIVL